MKAVYIRTSTQDQEPENQIASCISMFEGEYTIYKDKQSAWKDNVDRIDFEKLRNDIKQDRIKQLYVWDLDRLYRNRKKLIAFFKFCNIYKCKIHSYRQNFFESIHKMPEPWDEAIYDLMLQVMGWMSEDESNKKSERVKSAIIKEEGKVTKSYKGNKWGRRAIPKPAMKKVLELHNQGKSIREISKLVQYTDKNNNMKYVSKSAVHKIISQNIVEK